MGEKLFDDLARTLATPMPRRRVLRLLGASLVALSVPGMRPRLLRAAGPPGIDTCLPNERTCLKDVSEGANREYCCPPPAWNRVCGTKANGYRCGTICQETKKQFPCDSLPDRYGWTNGVCCIRKFGPVCDPKGPQCIFKCDKGREKCGKTCCPKTTFCCNAKQGICCDKKKGSCCNVGPKGKPQMMCCTEPSQCATEADETGTTPKGARNVCCPEERVVPLSGAKTCCPAGYVSLGGKLVVPPGNLGGLCCRKDKVCGTGKNKTCCSTGARLAPELEQICCGSTCVSFKMNRNNCGACGNACAPGESCVNGVCA